MTWSAAFSRRIVWLLWAGLAPALSGCAGVLPRVEREPSWALTAAPDAPLARIARHAGLPAGASGVWPLLQGHFALDTRLALIANATTSIDLQSYLIGDDAIGRLILRALRDAAARGVRVRLLVDDLYTGGGVDRLLLGLAATPNVEVRLFNPFVTDRESNMRRLLALGLDFARLNHRMHNKLFIADGAAAVVGGRNLDDEYFQPGTAGYFIDFDVVVAGAVVPELSGWFDLYWNSDHAYDLHDVLRASAVPGALADELQRAFDVATQPAATRDATVPLPDVDFFGAPPFSRQLAERRVRLLAAPIVSYADAPSKIDRPNPGIPGGDTLAQRFLARLAGARRDVLLISPYFIPGPHMLDRLRGLREAGVKVRVLTNSLAVSDEPIVSVGFGRYQVELLKMGVEIYELSSTRLKLDSTLRGVLGNATGRLHAKIGFVDGRTVLVGSLNMDPRSASINTELGIAVDSPQLFEMVRERFHIDESLGTYRVVLRPDGAGVRWTVADTDAPGEAFDVDPDTSFWQRLRLLFISLFVPESLL